MKTLSTISTINLRMPPSSVAYLLKGCNYLCFLDSSLYPNKYSKFSYIAWDPKFVIKSSGYRNEFINIPKGIKYYSYQHPLFFLKQNVNNYICSSSECAKNNIKTLFIGGDKVREVTDSKNYSFDEESDNLKKNSLVSFKLPDFRGGFIGYLSYDLKNYIESLPQSALDDTHLPIFYFAYYDKLISYSHDESRWYFIRNFLIRTKNEDNKDVNFLEDDYIDSNAKDRSLIKKINLEVEKINKIIRSPRGYNMNLGALNIGNNIIKKYSKKNISNLKLRSNFTRRNYLKTVSKAKEYIHNGDIYQVNFSHRFESSLPVEPMDLYYILREKNAAPFSAYLGFPEVKVGSSSPERFLFLKDGIIETRPIKGTRPRGKDELEDKKYAEELKNSIKDRAELNMIVDLERNDLGKFCNYGSVRVSEHAVIEKYARVFHSVSTVVGKVKKEYDIEDIIKATFPGGSITGAPKIRAMEIIDELEPTVRSVYTGSIGYIGIDNTMDLNIVIRTFVIKGSKFYYNVGGGIVEDSISEDEYRETLDKGVALQDTLKFFEGKNLKKFL